MKFLVAAGLLGLAFASCPNQCSGHGRCDEFDKCICNRQDGTNNPYRYAYTGVDCSLRTCPTGKAYDAISTQSSQLSAITFKPSSAAGSNGKPDGVPKLRAFYNAALRNTAFTNLRRDQKFVVKVMSVNTDSTPHTASFSWKLEEDEYFGTETTFYPNDASKKDFVTPERARHLENAGLETGVFVYFDKGLNGAGDFTGLTAGDVYSFSLAWNDQIDFSAADANSAHQELECSGRGTCDYASGKCKCADGYTGEACQRTACPNSCSGHGQCQSEQRFVKDSNLPGGNLYDAYDAAQQYGCRCDEGYRGPDCSLIECPSGADILGGDGGAGGMDCSGRGLCDYSTGVCKCHKGYYGERCESQTTFM